MSPSHPAPVPAAPPGRVRRLGVAACLTLAAGLALACGGFSVGPEGPDGGPGGGEGEGPGHRSQRLALTPQEELELGRQAYKEILSKSHVLPQDRPEVRKVREIGRRIARAAEIEPLQREINLHLRSYKFEWEFNVLQDKRVNAFCLPGGKVAVYTGLLPVAENDDQLATVMSHEIAHALAHHASERIAVEQLTADARRAAGGSLETLDADRRQALIGALAAGAVGSDYRARSYERAQELEADHIGVFLMTFAGYDPQEAVRFWERMADRAGGPRVPEILSDHPSDETRIRHMQNWVPQAEAAKRAFESGHVVGAPAGR